MSESIAKPQIQTAVFSPDRAYRYTLWRHWNQLISHNRYVMFIGLNPSTADETQDDPTIRRCIGFAKSWGYDGLCMTNLFAFRATDPRVMKGQPKPIGDENDRWLAACAREATIIIAVWGKDGRFMARDEEVCKLLYGLQCLGRNADGTPRHPLYLKATTAMEDYEA